MTSYEEWNRSDGLSMELYFANNPVSEGGRGLDAVLEVIEHQTGFLVPDMVAGPGKRDFRYSRQRAREQLRQITPTFHSLLLLKRKGDVHGYWSLDFGGVRGGHDVSLHFPLGFFRRQGAADARCQQLVHVARALCQHLAPVSHGFAHSETDTRLGSPLTKKPTSPPGAYEAYWLNVYGKSLVDSLGRERVLSLPAHSVESLPCGGVLWLSTPTLADFDSPEARRAQARCLVHLRPELRLEDVERSLLERSLAFQPIDKNFDPDISGLVERIIQDQTGLPTRRKEIERYNHYRPPPVSEWLPANEVRTDVDDPKSKIAFYEVQAESLIAILHTEHPSVLDQEPGSIIDVDYYVGRERWAEFMEHMHPDKRVRLVPMLGAYLGELLVKHLGGRWVPRHSLLESAVVVGPRAWLPFLRAHHLLQVPSNLLGKSLDSTLSQLFHQAVRLASV